MDSSGQATGEQDKRVPQDADHEPVSRPNPDTSGLWWERWSAPLPLEWIDPSLLLLRWGIILILGVPSLFGPFQGVALLPPLVALLAMVIYNAPISYFVWRWRPLAHGRGVWLLINDALQFALIVFLTGGYRSFYTLLFLLVMIEVGLSLRPRSALALVISMDALQLGVSVIGQDSFRAPDAAYIVVNKFIVLLIFGVVIVLLGELVRREERAWRQATRRAAQVTELNQLLMHLGESVPDLDLILNTILNSALSLPSVTFGLVLLPGEAGNNTWRVAASNTERHPVDKYLTESLPPANTQQPQPAPHEAAPTTFSFVADDGADQLVGLFLRAPDGETVGALVVGRPPGQPWLWSEEDEFFLHALAIEAGLALRNARLFAHEQEHIAHLQHFQASQTTFFSAIAHELKTPLTVLKMLGPSLRTLSALPETTQGEILDTVDHNLARLEVLIRDMLDSARLEAGAVSLHCQATPLDHLVERTLEDLAPLLTRQEQRASLYLEPGLPPVWADPRRVEQILSNLVVNAAKFSSPGSDILVELTRQSEVVQVCVGDWGPGVPLAERQRIFDRFYTTIGNQALSGAGLGLFIGRELVHLHGGRIWVEDNDGGGSRFCFTLPIVRPATEGELEASHAKSKPQNPGD